jgi:ABC-2 type transport system ATP-binding protein
MTRDLLDLRNLTVSFGSHDAIRDVSLRMSQGEWVSLVGPNGSGKTTLLRCVSGQLRPSTGEVRISGYPLGERPERAKQSLGVSHAPEALPGLLTGRQCLEVYAAAHDLDGVDAGILDMAGSFRLRSALEDPVLTYSLGMKQKLSILLALSNDPRLLVLDESFNGLDPASAWQLKRELRQRVEAGRCSVLLATHALDLVLQYSTRAAMLIEGRLCSTWSDAQMQRLRARGIESLEMEMASHGAQ